MNDGEEMRWSGRRRKERGETCDGRERREGEEEKRRIGRGEEERREGC